MITRIGALKSVDEFRQLLSQLHLELPCDDEPCAGADSPLAQPVQVNQLKIGNRWTVHPMEGWDGTPEGRPTEQTRRRWRNFGASGCKLIWGGEAVAVCHAGRANPRQLRYSSDNESELISLRSELLSAHQQEFGANATQDLVLGLQLTHSGRFCKPNDPRRFESRIAYHHPLLDAKFGIDPGDSRCVLTDGELRELIDQFVAAARGAERAGFQFVDIKACHGYLGHELLSGFDRPGPYGGDLAGRSRWLREIVAAIRSETRIEIGVRLSVFDQLPYRPDPATSHGHKLGRGVPLPWNVRERGPYPVFGSRRDDPGTLDLAEPLALIRQLRDEAGVCLWNLSAGSPYYNPHIQRPAAYPPSDGYQPPEDPLVGCVRQIQAVRQLRSELAADEQSPAAGGSGCRPVYLVGTAYTYFQEYLPQVAQAVVRSGWVDSVGLGRIVLSDWQLPTKVITGQDYRSGKKLCRTFSDCTTAPRNGLISGCYPLDPYYKALPEAAELKQRKQASN